MKAEELRLNNWVLSLGKDGIWYNSKISKIEVQNIIVGVGFKRKLKPIPLSEDILLKCGFEKKVLDRYSYCELLVKNTKFITDDKGKVRIGISGPGQFEYFLLEIEYLHQLQNLYYSLTGQELNIDL